MFKEIGELKVHYEVSGEGHALILMHGGQMRMESWEEMVPILAKEFRVFAYDARGHGQTKMPPGSELTHDLWADDLVAFMDTFGVEKAAVAGSSRGAATGLNFAVRYPDRISHLITLGAGSPLLPPSDRSGFNERKNLKDAGASGEEIMEKTFEFTLNAFSPNTPKTNPAALDKVRKLLVAHYSLPDEEVSIPARISANDIGSRLGEIQCPTLLLVGDGDSRTPIPMSESLNTHIPNSYMKIIANSGHSYTFEQPELCSQLMIKFIKTFS